jgi:hypothetical protein
VVNRAVPAGATVVVPPDVVVAPPDGVPGLPPPPPHAAKAVTRAAVNKYFIKFMSIPLSLQEVISNFN